MTSLSPLTQNPNTKHMEDLVFTRLRKYVPVALDNPTSDRYENLVKMLRSPDNHISLTNNYPVLFKLLANIANVASRLDPHNHTTLVEIILTFDGKVPDYVLKAWCTLMFSMCTSNVSWVEQVLTSLCKILCGKYSLELFTKRHNDQQQQLQYQHPTTTMGDILTYDPTMLTATPSMSDNSNESTLVTLDTLQQCIHTTISLILSHIPMSSRHIINSIVETGPHYTASLLQQCLWVEVVLRICETAPTLRDALLTTILEKLLSLDIHLSRSITRVFSVLSKEYVTLHLQSNQFTPSSPQSPPSSPILNTLSVLCNNSLSSQHFNSSTISSTTTSNDPSSPVVKTELFNDIDSIPHTSATINNITITTPTDHQKRINLDNIFDRNEEMRSIDGLLLILSNYLWLVANTPDHDGQIYDDVITIAHIHNGSPQTHRNSTVTKMELPDLIPLKLENQDIQVKSELLPDSFSKCQRIKSELNDPRVIEGLSSNDKELLSVMAQPMRKAKGILSPSTQPNSTPSTSSNNENLLPPLLQQTTSERIQHDQEISFEIKSLLNQQRSLEENELDSAKSSPHTGPFLPLSGLPPSKPQLPPQQQPQVKISKLNDDVFGSLFRTFNRTVLPTQGSHFIQWLLFYQISFRFEYVEVLLRLLTDRLSSPRSNNTIRVSCIWYITSLLVRAKFIRIATASSTLNTLAMWAHQYMDGFASNALKQQQTTVISTHNSGSSGQNTSVLGTDNFQSNSHNLYSPENHVTFFAALEGLLYILSHRPDIVRQVKPIQLVQENTPQNEHFDPVNDKQVQPPGSNSLAIVLSHQSKIQQRRSILTPMHQDLFDTAEQALPGQSKTQPHQSTKKLHRNQQQQEQPLQNLQTEFSPVLSPLIAGTSIPTLSIAPQQLQPLSSVPANRSVSITESSALRMSDLIPKHLKPITLSTKTLTLRPSTQDPLHVIALLTSVLRPSQFLSPLLVEKYLLLYHNIASLPALLDPVFQSNINIHQYAHRSDTRSNNAQNAQHRPVQQKVPVQPGDLTLLSRLIPNKSNSLTLPTVYVASSQQTINLSSCVSANSTSVQQTLRLFEQLTAHQREILSTFIKQQIQLFIKYGPTRSQDSTVQRIPAQQLTTLFDDVVLSSSNPNITLVDLQNVGIYPLLHTQSPLGQYCRSDSRPPSHATSIGSKRQNKRIIAASQSSMKSLHDKKQATGRTIAELDAEDANQRYDLSEFDYLAGLTTLQVHLSFVDFPFDPFFPPSLREQLLSKYNLSFDTYRSSGRYWRDFILNGKKKFVSPSPSTSVATGATNSIFSSLCINKSDVQQSNSQLIHHTPADGSETQTQQKSSSKATSLFSSNKANQNKDNCSSSILSVSSSMMNDVNCIPLELAPVPLSKLIRPTKSNSFSTPNRTTPPFDRTPPLQNRTSPFASPLFKSNPSAEMSHQTSNSSFQTIPLFGSPFVGQVNHIVNTQPNGNISRNPQSAPFDQLYGYSGINDGSDPYAGYSNPILNTASKKQRKEQQQQSQQQQLQQQSQLNQKNPLTNHIKSRQSIVPRSQSVKKKPQDLNTTKKRQSLMPNSTTSVISNVNIATIPQIVVEESTISVSTAPQTSSKKRKNSNNNRALDSISITTVDDIPQHQQLPLSTPKSNKQNKENRKSINPNNFTTPAKKTQPKQQNNPNPPQSLVKTPKHQPQQQDTNTTVPPSAKKRPLTEIPTSPHTPHKNSNNNNHNTSNNNSSNNNNNNDNTTPRKATKKPSSSTSNDDKLPQSTPATTHKTKKVRPSTVHDTESQQFVQLSPPQPLSGTNSIAPPQSTKKNKVRKSIAPSAPTSTEVTKYNQ